MLNSNHTIQQNLTIQTVPHICWHTNVSFSGLDDTLIWLVKDELINGMSYGFNLSEKFINLNHIYPNLAQKNKLQNTQVKISFDIDIPLSGIYQIFAFESAELYNLLLKIITENYMSGKLENYINQLIQKLSILNLSGISVAELTNSPMSLVQLENIIMGPTSEVPSNAPSGSPTVEPSDVPTVNPTVNPSYLPTTIKPSSNPTVEPSDVPTVDPSYLPTTIKPSSNPTVHPSSCPSYIPSYLPTTIKPSSNPTVHPSSCPSYIPSYLPTTIKPSSSPSFVSLTKSPSLNPSIYSLIKNLSEIPSLSSILSELPSVYLIGNLNNTNNNYESQESNNEVNTIIIISSVLLFLLATVTVTHYIRIKQQVANSENVIKIKSASSIVPEN